MKKRQTLLSRLLLPVLVVLLLLPPLSCLLFQQAAARYAYGEAAGDLEDLQQNILPLMESSFAGQAETPEEASEQVGEFLRQAGPLAHRMGGRASLMVLSPDFRMVYPRVEEERESAAPLAEAWAQAIQNGELPSGSDALEWTDNGGETWLVRVYEVPAVSMRLRYLITYCSVSSISAWVFQTSLLVLLISGLFVLLAIAVLWMTARSVSQPLNRLCREAEKIGAGDFSQIAPTFSLRELEQLRTSMNEMTEKLRHSDQVQKDFFQNVSHELRNPLMSISGYAQGVEQGVFPDPKGAAHTILEESVRLTELVNSLLTLSRMESGQNAPDLAPVLLGDAIADCLDRFHGLALQKGVVLSAPAVDSGLAVLGDEELLGNVLDNLVSNAIRYTKTAVTVAVAAEGGCVQISVLDDGAGIAGEDLPHLFERCYKGPGGNFGLGLSIAQTAAKTMGGTLTAANRSEGGAAFTLTLPRADAHHTKESCL
ncbi:MAG: sensor histidine kinase [Acutalibacter sp.]